MNIFSLLENADKNLFRLINRQLSSEWLDGFMKLLRYPITWMPLYVFILYFFYKNYKAQFLFVVIFSVITVALTDYISAGILKPLLERVRPCYEPGLNVRSLVGCGGTYGMPSSHASNHFGLAAFWFMIVLDKFSKKWHWVWLWAFAVCYAQVYVGKHYPADVFFGGILGTSIGLITSGLFEFTVSRFLNSQKKVSLRLRKPHWNL
jgi:membrane-associated phospholipid phosphatase